VILTSLNVHTFAIVDISTTKAKVSKSGSIVLPLALMRNGWKGRFTEILSMGRLEIQNNLARDRVTKGCQSYKYKNAANLICY